MAKSVFVLVLVGFLAFGSVDCLGKFIRGRRFEKPAENLHAGVKYPPEQYFDQRLDHFDESLTATWKQRYWINDTFFDGTGPVFIMIGGEGTENPKWIVSGEWIVLAESFNALCVLVEHRYYGQSHPTEDLSTSNMVYLSSEQALADLATIRTFIHKSYNLTDQNRWVSFGGSYSGSLSAWLRLKYPHLFHAAVASSAPMLAIIDFTDYLVVVNKSLGAYNLACPTAFNNAIQLMKSYMATPNGREYLASLFSTCEAIDTQLDITNFYSTITGIVDDVVQYNKDNRASNFTIDTVCDVMLDASVGDELNRFAKLNMIYMTQTGITCQDAGYDSFIQEMQAISWNESAAVGGRQWTYQTCVEFGFFQSTDDIDDQPFGNTMPVQFFIQQCQDIFGPSFNLTMLRDAVANTNINYGGYNYQGTRVVFVNGKVDPWHALGFTGKPPNPLTQVVYIDGTAHCADMYPPSPLDPQPLISARAQIKSYLYEWLAD